MIELFNWYLFIDLDYWEGNNLVRNTIRMDSLALLTVFILALLMASILSPARTKKDSHQCQKYPKENL